MSESAKSVSLLTTDQTDCIDFITDGEDSLVAADIGTGKTVIAGTAMRHALDHNNVGRWLVLAPKLVAMETWADEFQDWEHLRRTELSIACGSASARQAAVDSRSEIVVTNYENLAWFADEHRLDTFDGLCCDEIDKLKSVSSKRYKSFRNEIGRFNMRVGLTGSLIPNRLDELWGQVFMVDAGQTFGRSFYKWRKPPRFYPEDYTQRKWLPFPGYREECIEAIADLSYRLKAVGLPEVIFANPMKVDMPASLRPLYDELEHELFLRLENDETVDAASEAVLVNKLQQVCAGFSYVDEDEARERTYWHTEAKFDALGDLMRSVWPEQVLIFYNFVEERSKLLERFPGVEYIGGGVSVRQARDRIHRWNRGDLRYLALHPASAGHGLNLQKSGAQHIAFLTWPWSGGMLKQVCGRLARRGALVDRIIAHSFAFQDTIDETTRSVATGKLNEMEKFLDDLETAARA